MSDHPSDDDLMLRGAQGNDEAFRILVGRWEKPVFAFLERMLGSREESQDIAQETFVKVCQQAGKYEPRGQFRSWLFRIAGNMARSRLRRRKILQWIRFDPVVHDRAGTSTGANDLLERKEQQAVVRGALNRLPARQRQAVVLRQYEAFSYREIAESMQTTVSAVETLLFRAMNALRKDLERLEGQE